jgi:DNA-binding NtrC family response regulator
MKCPLCGSSVKIENKIVIDRGGRKLEIDDGLSFDKKLEALEEFLVRLAVEESNGKKAAALETLRIKPHTLRWVVEKYNIDCGFRRTGRPRSEK